MVKPDELKEVTTVIKKKHKKEPKTKTTIEEFPEFSTKDEVTLDSAQV